MTKVCDAAIWHVCSSWYQNNMVHLKVLTKWNKENNWKSQINNKKITIMAPAIYGTMIAHHKLCRRSLPSGNRSLLQVTQDSNQRRWSLYPQQLTAQHRCSDSVFFESGSNPVLQIVNPNPIRYQLDLSNPTPVWVRENISQSKNQ